MNNRLQPVITCVGVKLPDPKITQSCHVPYPGSNQFRQVRLLRLHRQTYNYKVQLDITKHIY